MKKLMMALVCLVLSQFSYSNESIRCYDNLLSGSIDSKLHQINIAHMANTEPMKQYAVDGLKQLMLNCGCEPKFKKVQCGEAIKGNPLTKICYVESSLGYFLINKDYLDNLNIIFNRWD